MDVKKTDAIKITMTYDEAGALFILLGEQSGLSYEQMGLDDIQSHALNSLHTKLDDILPENI